MAKRAKKVAKSKIPRRKAAPQPFNPDGTPRMARYKAAAKLLVDNRLVSKDEIFESDKPPGLAWIPLDEPAKELVGDRPRVDRSRRPITLNAPSEEDLQKDEEARTAPHRAKTKGDVPHKRASPGKSVTRQQTDGEEPTVGHIHDGED
jgi:hypothetical protein